MTISLDMVGYRADSGSGISNLIDASALLRKEVPVLLRTRNDGMKSPPGFVPNIIINCQYMNASNSTPGARAVSAHAIGASAVPLLGSKSMNAIGNIDTGPGSASSTYFA